MNKIFFFILSLFTVGHVIAQNKALFKKNFTSLHWLVGTWERTNVKPGIKAHEEWHLDSANHLRGIGLTMKEEDTLFIERIQILMDENNIYYVADVKGNQAPVYFAFTTLTKNGFVCENPEHDFPKKIEYNLKDSILTVRISSGGKSQNYIFMRR
jgi:hypothetical protein